VRFRGGSVHVYDLRASQIQLVTTHQNKGRSSKVDGDIPTTTIEMKDVNAERGAGLGLLRGIYTLVAAFFTGIVSVPLLLMLFVPL
jgi:hypothetical protein